MEFYQDADPSELATSANHQGIISQKSKLMI
jgi:hypothetical protein